MPHSSGGGSHSSGSHYSGGHSSSYRSSSSSSYSGSSSYVPSARISRSYFEGAKKYVYYDNSGRMQYRYSDRRPEKPDFTVVIIAAIIFTLIGGGIIWLFLQMGLYIPRPLKASSYQSGTTIIDELGVIDNQKELETVLQEFLEKTGVSPAIEIVSEDKWYGNYDDLETYAYSEYLRLFDDEKHWLVVISLPGDYESQDFVDWKWEGMVGDDCYPAFNSESEDLFTTTIQRYLLRSESETIGEGLKNAYASFNQVCMNKQVSGVCLGVAGVVFVIYLLCMGITINSYLEDKICYEGVPVAKNAKERNCEYCGCLYIQGTVRQCPGCGAPIMAQESVKK